MSNSMLTSDIYIYIYMCVCVYIHIHIHIHIHLYIHISSFLRALFVLHSLPKLKKGMTLVFSAYFT